MAWPSREPELGANRLSPLAHDAETQFVRFQVNGHSTIGFFCTDTFFQRFQIFLAQLIQAATHPEGWTVGGMAKGAGMLAPGLATMLVVLTTDADVPADELGPIINELKLPEGLQRGLRAVQQTAPSSIEAWVQVAGSSASTHWSASACNAVGAGEVAVTRCTTRRTLVSTAASG